MNLDLKALLLKAGAGEPRSGRGKWRCPLCRKMRVSVNFDKGVFFCFSPGCEFKGNTITLARSVGFDVGSAEWKEQAAEIASRLQWERLAHVLRVHEWRRVTEAYRMKRQEYEDVRSVIRAGGDGTDLERGLRLAEALRHLDAELLLIETLPAWLAACFIRFGPAYREREIAEVLKRGGVLVHGVFHELLPFGGGLEVSDEAGPEMPEESWTPRRQPGPGGDPLSLEEIDAQAKAFRTAAEKAGNRR